MPINEQSSQPSSSNAGLQHPIPQNVMDVEFKVFGNLTVRQLVYAAVGIALGYAMWRSTLPGFWRLVFALLFAGTGLSVAFISVQERGLDVWLISFIRSMFVETQMVWKKTYSPPAYFLADYAQIIRNEIITLTPAKSRSKLDEYLGQMPGYMNELDILEKKQMDRLTSHFDEYSSNNSFTSTNISPNPLSAPTISAPTIVSTLDQDLSDISDTKFSNSEVDVIEPPVDKTVSIIPQSDTIQQIVIEKPKDISDNNQSKTTVQSSPDPKPSTPATKVDTKPAPTATPPKKENPKYINIDIKPDPIPEIPKKKKIKIDERDTNIPSLNDIVESEMDSKAEMLETLTGSKIEILSSTRVDRPLETDPDVFKGEIKIHTTTKLPPTIVAQDIKEIKRQEQELRKKVDELMDVTRQAKEEAATNKSKDKYKDRIQYFQDKFTQLNKEKSQITSEIEKNTARIKQLSGNKQQEPLEKLVNDLSQQNINLSNQLKSLESELFELKDNPQKKQPEPKPQPKQSPDIPTSTVQAPQSTQQLTQQNNQDKTVPHHSMHLPHPHMPHPHMPQNSNHNNSKHTVRDPNGNIISGTIKDKQGKLIAGGIVLIKDHEGNVIRALKTNTLGQFKVQSPLPNGKYTVEAIKGGENFDIIQFEATGAIINPMNLIANQ